MGRPSFGEPTGKLSLFRVNMVDGDYDDGGAYWGGNPSLPLFCARGEGYQQFVRAHTRREAMLKLDISKWLRKSI